MLHDGLTLQQSEYLGEMGKFDNDDRIAAQIFTMYRLCYVN